MTQIKVDKQTLEHFKAYLEQQASYMEGQMDGQDVNIDTNYYGWYEATNHYISLIEKAEQNPNYSFFYGDLTETKEVLS
jgi:hypothetical protein